MRCCSWCAEGVSAVGAIIADGASDVSAKMQHLSPMPAQAPRLREPMLKQDGTAAIRSSQGRGFSLVGLPPPPIAPLDGRAVGAGEVPSCLLGSTMSGATVVQTPLTQAPSPSAADTYIGMAYVVMAYIVVAYIVMPKWRQDHLPLIPV